MPDFNGMLCDEQRLRSTRRHRRLYLDRSLHCLPRLTLEPLQIINIIKCDYTDAKRNVGERAETYMGRNRALFTLIHPVLCSMIRKFRDVKTVLFAQRKQFQSLCMSSTNWIILTRVIDFLCQY